jgi:hypothetical protein
MSRSKLLQITLLTVVAYIASYLAFSRYCLYTHPVGHDRKFLYVPTSPHRVHTSNALVFMHTALTWIYYPVWSIDHYVFGGPEYAEFYY